MAIRNGDTVVCKVTGFRGVVTALIEYWSGRVEAQVRPPIDPNGKYSEGQWIDTFHLQVQAHNMTIGFKQE